MLTISEIRTRMVPTYAGVRIIETPYLVDRVEDWSRVRSPGRAARRRRQGHRQNIVTHERPMRGCIMVAGTMFVHPERMRAIQDDARASLNRLADRQLLGLLRP